MYLLRKTVCHWYLRRDLLFDELSGDAEGVCNIVEAERAVGSQQLDVRLDASLTHVMLVMRSEHWVHADLCFNLRITIL